MQNRATSTVPLLFLLPFLFCVSACTKSIRLEVPATRMISPESTGDTLRFHGKAGWGAESELLVVDSIEKQPLDLNQRSLNAERGFFAAGDLGLMDKLDIGAHWHLDSSIVYRLKYQFLGDSFPEADKGNIALSAQVGGAVPIKRTYTGDTIFGSQSARVEERESAYDFSLIAGYRFNNSFLLYGGPFLNRWSLYGSIVQSGGNNPQTANFDEYLWQKGVHLGVSLNKENIGILIEGMWIQAKSQRNRENKFNYSLAMQLLF